MHKMNLLSLLYRSLGSGIVDEGEPEAKLRLGEDTTQTQGKKTELRQRLPMEIKEKEFEVEQDWSMN